MISLLHPSRSRPENSYKTLIRWMGYTKFDGMEVIVSLDNDDPLKTEYEQKYYARKTDMLDFDFKIITNDNKSAVDAINNAANVAKGDYFIVVSDDTDCYHDWDYYLWKEIEGKTDFILKTQDGIQPYIITFPIMDRAYYNRTGYIYHPTFEHMFCDTYATCVADITGRKLTSKLLFPHQNDSIKDDLRKRTDATWKQGEELFIKLMKEFSPEERARITDPSMRNWLRNKGVR